MTEAQIEGRVEKAVDRLDAAFMAGKIPQAEYDARMKAIDAEAQRNYRLPETLREWRL